MQNYIKSLTCQAGKRLFRDFININSEVVRTVSTTPLVKAYQGGTSAFYRVRMKVIGIRML